MRWTFVISGFPAIGKSHCCNCKSDYKMIDSDSSQFSWIKDDHGNNTTSRNPNFINDYITHIKYNIGKVDVIFVSSHAEVRKALYDNGIKTIIVYPDRDLKDVWIKRLRDRNSPESMINLISDNWYKFINDITNESYGFLKLLLSDSESYLDIHMIEKLFKDDIVHKFLN